VLGRDDSPELVEGAPSPAEHAVAVAAFVFGQIRLSVVDSFASALIFLTKGGVPALLANSAEPAVADLLAQVPIVRRDASE